MSFEDKWIEKSRDWENIPLNLDNFYREVYEEIFFIEVYVENLWNPLGGVLQCYIIMKNFGKIEKLLKIVFEYCFQSFFEVIKLFERKSLRKTFLKITEKILRISCGIAIFGFGSFRYCGSSFRRVLNTIFSNFLSKELIICKGIIIVEKT